MTVPPIMLEPMRPISKTTRHLRSMLTTSWTERTSARRRARSRHVSSAIRYPPSSARRTLEQSTLQSTLPAHVGRAKEPEHVAETKVLVDETNKAEHVDRAEKLETVDRGPCCALGLGDMTTNTGFMTDEIVEFAESMQ